MLEIISVIIAGVAIAVSVGVWVDNRRREARAAQLARKPALVFTWDQARLLWMLNNIGSGPALDVVIIQRIEGKWCHPLRMPEMAADHANSVPRRWYEAWHQNPGLGASYRSIAGEDYATNAGNDCSEITEGWRDLRQDSALIEPHWKYRGAATGN